VRFVSSGKELLYDLEKDPNEQRDVAGDSAYAASLTELRSLHKEWVKATK